MTKHLSIKEFRELGLLQEVNRRFFHPIGLALAINTPTEDHIDEGKDEWSLAYIIDNRDDPEGFCFGDVPTQDAYARSNAYDEEVTKRLHARSRLFAKEGIVSISRNGWQPLATMNMLGKTSKKDEDQS